MAAAPSEAKIAKVGFAEIREIAKNAETRAAAYAVENGAPAPKTGFFRDMFTSKGSWNIGKLVASRRAAANAAEEIGWGRPPSSSVRFLSGNGASAEVQSARAVSEAASEVQAVQQQVFIKAEPNYRPPSDYAGSYAEEKAVVSSNSSVEIDRFQNYGVAEPQKAVAFHDFIMDLILQQNQNIKSYASLSGSIR